MGSFWLGVLVAGVPLMLGGFWLERELSQLKQAREVLVRRIRVLESELS